MMPVPLSEGAKTPIISGQRLCDLESIVANDLTKLDYQEVEEIKSRLESMLEQIRAFTGKKT